MGYSATGSSVDRSTRDTQSLSERPLIFVSHPDDESLGCSAVLQRARTPVVVFATDGAPIGYNIETLYGSLAQYSKQRFEEASSALSRLPDLKLYRLRNRAGDYFRDQHLHEHLEEAAESLLRLTSSVRPSALVSHAYEGGHVDHDACSFLAYNIGCHLKLSVYEFPLYWRDSSGAEVFGSFRDDDRRNFQLNLSSVERMRKQEMLRAYKTQANVISLFPISGAEWIRSGGVPNWTERFRHGYSFQNRATRLSSDELVRAFSKFNLPDVEEFYAGREQQPRP